MSGFPLFNFIGHPGSGKTTVVNGLVERHPEFSSFRPSNVIGEFAISNGYELADRASYIRAHQAMLSQNPRAMVDAVIDRYYRSEGRLFLDGLRVPSHVNAIQTETKQGLVTIALLASDEERFRRVSQDIVRQDASRLAPKTLNEFLEDEAFDNQTANPDSASVPIIMTMADLIIDTEVQIDEPYRIDAVIDEVDEWLQNVYGIGNGSS